MTAHVAEPKLFKLPMDRISHLQGRRIILCVDELKRGNLVFSWNHKNRKQAKLLLSTTKLALQLLIKKNVWRIA